MNTKTKVGTFISVFVAIVVALAIYSGGIVENVGNMRNTYTATNDTITSPAEGEYTDITGQELIGDYDVINQSGTVIETGDVQLVERVGDQGVKTISIFSPTNSNYTSTSVNVTYTYGPDGYAEDAGTRSVVLLIALFSALAIATIALWPAIKDIANIV